MRLSNTQKTNVSLAIWPHRNQHTCTKVGSRCMKKAVSTFFFNKSILSGPTTKYTNRLSVYLIRQPMSAICLPTHLHNLSCLQLQPSMTSPLLSSQSLLAAAFLDYTTQCGLRCFNIYPHNPEKQQQSKCHCYSFHSANVPGAILLA